MPDTRPVTEKTQASLQTFSEQVTQIAIEFNMQLLEITVLAGGQVHHARWQPNLEPDAPGTGE